MADKWTQNIMQLAGEFQAEKAKNNGNIDHGKWLQQGLKLAEEFNDDFETDETKKQAKKERLAQANALFGQVTGQPPVEQEQPAETKPPKKRPPPGKPSYLTAKKKDDEEEEEAAKPAEEEPKVEEKPTRPPPGKPSYLISKKKDDEEEEEAAVVVEEIVVDDETPAEAEAIAEAEDDDDEPVIEAAAAEPEPAKPKKSRPPGGKPSYLIAKDPEPEDEEAVAEVVAVEDDDDAVEEAEAAEAVVEPEETAEEARARKKAELLAQLAEEDAEIARLEQLAKERAERKAKLEASLTEGDGDADDADAVDEEKKKRDDALKMAGAVAAGALGTAAVAGIGAAVAHGIKKDQENKKTEQEEQDADLAARMALQAKVRKNFKAKMRAEQEQQDAELAQDLGEQRDYKLAQQLRQQEQDALLAQQIKDGYNPPPSAPMEPSAPPAGQQYYNLTVPAGVGPGQPFKVNVNGQFFTVTCPPNASAGQAIKILLPTGGAPPARERSRSPVPTPKTQKRYVTIPNGVYPGQPFRINVDGKLFTITAPPNTHPGQRIQVELPATTQQPAPPSVPTTKKVFVTIPNGVYPGMPFKISVDGGFHQLNAPANSHPGQRIAVEVPTTAGGGRAHSRTPPRSRTQPPAAPPGTEFFDVVVPHGVRPGHKFKIRVRGSEFYVTCPMNAHAGQKIRVPVATGGGANAGNTGWNNRTPNYQPYV